ncbi:hypothetical protein M758_5G079300 [Ceratodon purpureus]|nr:hypothetical protein M758_5G079300 [Ceratodon purpureus]
MAMATAVAVGASVDVSYGVRGSGHSVGCGGLRQGRGIGPSVAMFPRGLGSFEVNLKCSWRPQRLTVRASKKSGPESGDKNKNEGEKGSVDWDKAWESFPKPKKQNPFNLFSLFNLDMEQYVNRRPTHSNFPLSEETDPMRKTERQALNAWTDSKFTLAGLGVVVGLFVYMVVVVGPPPS